MARDDMFSWIRQKLRHDAPEELPDHSPEPAPLEGPQNLAADEHIQEPENTQIPDEIAPAQVLAPSPEVGAPDVAVRSPQMELEEGLAPDPDVASSDVPEPSPDVAVPVVTQQTPEIVLEDVPAPGPQIDPVDVAEPSPDVAPVDMPAPILEVTEPEPTEDTGQPPIPINEQQRILEALTKVRSEPKPLPGMPAMELAPPRFRRAYVVCVKAGGRRITARIRDVDRIYCYTLRRDGTYRLEGVPTKAAPRLLLDIDV